MHVAYEWAMHLAEQYGLYVADHVPVPQMTPVANEQN
jgi:hypothetical protein